MFDFSAYFPAVIATLRPAFPAVPTIEIYPKLRTKIATPAIMLEFVDATPGENSGTEQLALIGRFEARVIFDTAPLNPGQNPELLCLSLATALAQHIYKAGRFGQPVGSAKVTRVEPDQFKPELAGYCVWLVEWTHELLLGDSVWASGPDFQPTEVWVGLAPLIGVGHEADYEEVLHG